VVISSYYWKSYRLFRWFNQMLWVSLYVLITGWVAEWRMLIEVTWKLSRYCVNRGLLHWISGFLHRRKLRCLMGRHTKNKVNISLHPNHSEVYPKQSYFSNIAMLAHIIWLTRELFQLISRYLHEIFFSH